MRLASSRRRRPNAEPELTPLGGELRQGWSLADDRGRVAPDLVIVRRVEAGPTEMAEQSWSDRLARVREQIANKQWEPLVRSLADLDIDDVERHIFRRLKRRRIAQIHISARKHLGRDSPLARATRYRFEVHRFWWGLRKKKWTKAAKWLNGFSPSDIRFFLARLPFTLVDRLHRAAIGPGGPGAGSNAAQMTANASAFPTFFPPRRSDAKPGPQLLGGWADKRGRRVDLPRWKAREKTLVKEIRRGNIPGWLRRWHAVDVRLVRPSLPDLRGTVYVLPDYLCVGSDTEYVHVPFDQASADKVARKLGAILPTAKICHTIYRSVPKPQRLNIIPRTRLPAGAAQNSSAAYLRHSELLQQRMASRGISPGTLVAGHKKDVVLEVGHHAAPNKIAFHGFYDAAEVPVQPCYNQHSGGAIPGCNPRRATLAHPEGFGRFSDYSQGVRLVHRWMLVDGKPRQVKSVLADPNLAKLVSERGVIKPARVPKGRDA